MRRQGQGQGQGRTFDTSRARMCYSADDKNRLSIFGTYILPDGRRSGGQLRAFDRSGGGFAFCLYLREYDWFGDDKFQIQSVSIDEAQVIRVKAYLDFELQEVIFAPDADQKDQVPRLLEKLGPYEVKTE